MRRNNVIANEVDESLKNLAKILIERKFPKVVIIEPERSCDFLKCYREISDLNKLENKVVCGTTSESVTTYKNERSNILLNNFGEIVESSHISAILRNLSDKTEKQDYFWHMEDSLKTVPYNPVTERITTSRSSCSEYYRYLNGNCCESI